MKRLFNFFVFSIICLTMINCKAKRIVDDPELQIELDTTSDMCSDYYKIYYKGTTDTVFVTEYEFEQGLQEYYVNMYGLQTIKDEYLNDIEYAANSIVDFRHQNKTYSDARLRHIMAQDILIDYNVVLECYEHYNPATYDWSSDTYRGFYTLGMIDKEIGELITRIRIWNEKFL